mmetsp:Transcript_6636/g.9362  ORF Transcript_6636/g.9362 Transcript_6636/m.9362 type:complete len:82 (-) Transcript_6636:687-932(-)
MSRAERMKRDLRYFLGADWKPDIKSMPVSVREYVAYIEEVSRERFVDNIVLIFVNNIVLIFVNISGPTYLPLQTCHIAHTL